MSSNQASLCSQDVEVYSSDREELVDMREDNRANHVVLPNSAQTIRSLPGHQPPKILSEGNFQ